MLYGGYQHNIDKKGRVFIPAKFRDELGDNFMLCRGIYGKRCLCVYSMEQWEKLVEKIGSLPASKSSVVKRFLYDGSFSVEFDTQGRVLIPAVLREYAELEGEAHIIGMDTNLEIWNTELWSAENEQYTPEMIAEIVEGLDF
ncbi:MAG: division/cell wall cluster transcriptional repressor MraZ [Oscillospiraceae bacterium]|nr:division/cell wall cluster transcriptional repressor MraZ [Oscillospiraceae bacterium]